MPKATNHNRKKAARRMEAWRRKKYEAAVKKAIEAFELIRSKLREPSLMSQIFGAVDIFRDESEVDFIITGADRALEPDRTVLIMGRVGEVTEFSPTGRRIEPIHELSRRNYYTPGKVSVECSIENVDYGPLEARMAAASQRPVFGELYGLTPAQLAALLDKKEG